MKMFLISFRNTWHSSYHNCCLWQIWRIQNIPARRWCYSNVSYIIILIMMCFQITKDSLTLCKTFTECVPVCVCMWLSPSIRRCWLTDSALTTVSFSYFVLTFAVNMLCFGSVTVKVVRAHRQSPVLRERGMNRGTVLSLLGLAWLLGVSWGGLLGGPALPVWPPEGDSLLHLLHHQLSPWWDKIQPLFSFTSGTHMHTYIHSSPVYRSTIPCKFKDKSSSW